MAAAAMVERMMTRSSARVLWPVATTGRLWDLTVMMAASGAEKSLVGSWEVVKTINPQRTAWSLWKYVGGVGGGGRCTYWRYPHAGGTWSRFFFNRRSMGRRFPVHPGFPC